MSAAMVKKAKAKVSLTFSDMICNTPIKRFFPTGSFLTIYYYYIAGKHSCP
jgi:hypothetical protein